jgi:hypothetical protein
MIYIKDDFLDDNLIELLSSNKDEFQELKTPGKSFWVKNVPKPIADIIKFEIEDLEGNRIEPILYFIREAKEGQDNDWRIHNDSIIEGQQPDRACVLYISDTKQEGLHGTALWEHKKHGHKLDNISVEEQNRLLNEDANDLDLWDLKSVIGHKQNRLISYPCNYFHSKYPNEFVDNRIVFVMFYKIKK